MPNVVTNSAYKSMGDQKAKLTEKLADLLQQQATLDEQIEDVRRVINGLDRLLGSLQPAIDIQNVDAATQDALDKFTADQLTESERQHAIDSAA